MRETLILLRKELTDSLRDRRTLAMTLLVPLLLYPLLMMSMGAIMAAGRERLAGTELTVALCGGAEALLAGKAVPAHTRFVALSCEEAQAQLKAKKLGAVVEADADAVQALAANRQAHVTVFFTKRHDKSMEARDRVKRLLREVERGQLTTRLAALNLPETFAEPLDTKEQDVDFRGDLGPLIASRVLPTVLIIMLFLGAFYPAIDVTAGEKERGTLETLLVAPVRPLQVMFAKYLTVAAIANLATLVNLGAMAGALAFGVTLDAGLSATMKLGASQVAALLVGLVPSAFLVSGLSLAVASLARSFKEAQSLMTPLLMASMLPAVAATMPGSELTPVTAAVPLLNVALLVKGVVLGNVRPELVALTALSVAVFSLIALWLAANAFTSESLRFGGAESWRELFRLRR